MIKHIKGDLFVNVKRCTGNVIIPHIVNNIGAWGAGFVIPLAKAYPNAEDRYRHWYRDGYFCNTDFKLGNVQFVHAIENFGTTSSLVIANMIGQDGITSKSTGDRSRVVDRPLRYDALVKCMLTVAGYAKGLDSTPVIHCPKFGSGLAMGNFDFIKELIHDCWVRRGLDVVIYSLD